MEKTQILEEKVTEDVREFNIFVERPDQPSSIVPVRWCVSKQVLKDLQELGVERPYILFVIVHFPSDEYGGRFEEVDRHLVPFDKAMTFLEFKRPGVHKIFASIIWSWDSFELGTFGKKRVFLFKRSRSDRFDYGLIRREYVRQSKNGEKKSLAGTRICIHFTEYRFFSESGIKFYEYCTTKIIDIYSELVEEYEEVASKQAVIELNISDKFFAPEPPAWLKWWVNLWLENPKDQCSFRKRMTFAFTLNPFVFLGWMCLIAVWIFVKYSTFFLFGFWRKFSLDSKKKDSFCGIENANIFLQKAHCDPDGRWHYEDRDNIILTLPFLPFIWLVIGLGILLPSYFSFWGSDLTRSVSIWSAIGIPVIVVLIPLFIAVGQVIHGAIARFIPEENRSKPRLSRKERKRLRRQEEHQRFYDSLGDLTCHAGLTPKVSVEALNPKRVTIFLRLGDLKRRVCLPFAQK